MSSSGVNPEMFLIPLDEIRRATQNFSRERVIGDGGFGVVYEGQLSECWKNRTAAFKRFDVRVKQESRNEIEMMSNFKHENIISFIGYCDEEDKMISVFEYASNGSLDSHLHDVTKRGFLTWAHRLKICIGVARGLEYLHSGLPDNKKVFHRDIKSRHILLNDKLEAKISDFGSSLLVDQKQLQVDKGVAITKDPFNKDSIPIHTEVAGTLFYVDPIYKESGVLNKESDVYSFGIVLFEMLTGMLAYIKRVMGDDPQPQRLINLVRRYSDDNSVDKLVDPLIKDHINIGSVRVFKEIVYQCISWNLKERPKMNTIINKIQEALDVQRKWEDSIHTIQSSGHQYLNIIRIPLPDIILATENFSHETCIGEGGSSSYYKGQLRNSKVAIKRMKKYRRQQEVDEFFHELRMVSRFYDDNIISLIGYCDEHNEMILVYDYAGEGSLDRHLQDQDNKSCKTWEQRLKICLGVANGLKYLHSGLGWVDSTIIHRDIKSDNILLDDEHVAKIHGFGFSRVVDKNKPQVYELPAGTTYYIDPVYSESGIVNTELDVYSFGMVLLEMLTGTLAYKPRRIGDDQPQTLRNLVQGYYHDNGLDMLIDPLIRDKMNSHSFHVFVKIAYRCISYNLKDRPTMKRIVKRIEEALEIQTKMAQGATSTMLAPSHQHQDIKSFQILLNEIKYNDNERPIGDGGFGKVYKGQFSEGIVAIKCLDPEGHQGKKEFLNEVDLISSFHHPNIIPFVGYCDEDNQMIMVFEYADNGSLDHHLSNSIKKKSLRWTQCLKICLGAAKGLDYLHSGPGKGRVIHRDVKSANILLDKNMEAKLCDFGLSKKGPINQQTQIYTKAAGTFCYLDPVYRESNILTKESDVYSFGVVLFEMLSGSLVYNPITSVDGNEESLLHLVRRYCKKEPKKLIDPDIRDEINNQCFDVFFQLAYQCINFRSQKRPTMDTIIDRLEDAIEFQFTEQRIEERENKYRYIKNESRLDNTKEWRRSQAGGHRRRGLGNGGDELNH